MVSLSHPANDAVLRFLEKWRYGPALRAARSMPPEGIRDPYYGLGTHPDLVRRLWDEITADLPERCAWVIYGRPVLVNPAAEIVFGFALGTLVYALRLPKKERAEALGAGSERVYRFSDGTELNLLDISEEWVLGKWLDQEATWCRVSYEYAGSLA